jgi:hypothetical protein
MHARAGRLARGWIVGLIATTVAAVSHSLAGGYRPGALSFGAALVFAGLLGTVVISRRPSLPRLIIAIGGSQLAFHLMFSLLGPGGSTSGSAGVATSVSDPMQMGGMPPLAPITTAPMPDHLADPGMWIAHTVAAALTILFVRRAELAVWAMLTRFGRLVVTRLVPPAASPVTAATDSAHVPLVAPRPLIDRMVGSSARRRGPPLPAF